MIVAPAPLPLPSKTLMKALQEQAATTSISSVVRLAPRRGVDSRWRKGAQPILGPIEADELYRRLHHGPVAVVALAQTYVARDPRPPVLHSDNALALAEFVAHKALFAIVSGKPAIDEVLREFRAWADAVHCEGPSDPRVLPLQTFDAGSFRADLRLPSGRTKFNVTFGTQERRDRSDLTWRRGAAHGRDDCHVAGRSLGAGTHWDVEPTRGRGTVLNSVGVWAIPKRGYANIGPNADVRQGKRNTPSIKRVWAPPREAAP